MNPRCRNFQSLWLEHAPARPTGSPEGFDAHLASCEPCRAWVERTEAARAALGGLERHSAPAELEQRLFGAPDTELPVPSREADLPQGALLLQSLSRLQAPAVLERLVDEELTQPAQAQIRRFVGDLERPEVPADLVARIEERIDAGQPDAAPLDRRPAPRSLLRRLAPLTSLVAAGLLFLAMIDRGEAEEPRRLTVHRVSSAADLDPMARGMLDASLGGLLQAMPARSEERR